MMIAYPCILRAGPSHVRTMPSPTAAGKVPFTEKTIDAMRRLPFEQKPVGLDANGTLLTEAVPDDARDYFIRDASTPGFALRRYRTGIQTLSLIHI